LERFDAGITSISRRLALLLKKDRRGEITPE